MEILKKYKPKNYDKNLVKLKNVLGNDIEDVHDLISILPIDKLRVWIKITDYTLADNLNYLNESFMLITLVIKLFSKELDVENVSLSNNEIKKVLKRFSKMIKIDYAHRNGLFNKKPERYTLLKDYITKNADD